MSDASEFEYFDALFGQTRNCLAASESRWMQEACGLAFDYGREQGGLELQRVMLDKMEAESGNETIARLAKENAELRAKLGRLGIGGWLEGQLLRGQRGLGDMADAQGYTLWAGNPRPPTQPLFVSPRQMEDWGDALALAAQINAPPRLFGVDPGTYGFWADAPLAEEAPLVGIPKRVQGDPKPKKQRNPFSREQRLDGRRR